MDGRKNRQQNPKSGRGIRAVCRITGTALIVAVILLCSALIIPGVFGWHMYNVISGSMEPALKIGSLIYIHEDAPEDVEAEAIIAFYSSLEDRSIITHRVVKNNVVSGSFQTKGDANEGEDPTPVDYDNYIGSVKLVIPYMGEALAVMTSLYGKIAAACVVGLGVVLNLIGSRQSEEAE